jgi:hypothetical protein
MAESLRVTAIFEVLASPLLMSTLPEGAPHVSASSKSEVIVPSSRARFISGSGSVPQPNKKAISIAIIQ